jgi:hypothetical protein
MSPSAEIPVPTDALAPEYDAPPPGDRAFLQLTHPGIFPRRPASRVVDNPSEKPRVIVRG